MTSRKSFDRKTLENGLVYVVFECLDTCNVCKGVFSSMKDAKYYVMRSSIQSINIDHYNPYTRFKKRQDIFSLSKDAPIKWEDQWHKQSGTNVFYIQTWQVDSPNTTQSEKITYCILDGFIKTHISSNKLLWSKVKELIEKWRTMSNYESFSETCFSLSHPHSWQDDASANDWISHFETVECLDNLKSNPNHSKPQLTRHMSMMKRSP